VGGNPHCFSLSFDLVSSVLVVIFRIVSAVQVWGSVLLHFARLVSHISVLYFWSYWGQCVILVWGGVDISVCYC
jgi:hypothetical protein